MKYLKRFEYVNHDLNEKLIQSIEYNDFKSFMECINNDADVNYIYIDRDTFPLMEVVSTEVRTKELRDIRYNMMKVLLEKGANPNQSDDDGYTPLMIAAQPEPYIDMIELLIEYNADWNTKRGVRDFIDVLTAYDNHEYVNRIIKKYPEKYQKYLMIKDSERYNL